MSPADARVDTVVDAHLHVWNPDAVHYPWLTHDLVEIDRPFGVEDAARRIPASSVAHSAEHASLPASVDCLTASTEAYSDSFLAAPTMGPLTVPRRTSGLGAGPRLGRCTCVRPKLTHMFSSPMKT